MNSTQILRTYSYVYFSYYTLGMLEQCLMRYTPMYVYIHTMSIYLEVLLT